MCLPPDLVCLLFATFANDSTKEESPRFRFYISSKTNWNYRRHTTKNRQKWRSSAQSLLKRLNKFSYIPTGTTSI